MMQCLYWDGNSMASPSLNTRQIRKIETLIESWVGKLTWELLVEKIKSELDISITRQSLTTYKSIHTAYKHKKQELRGKGTPELIEFTKADIDAFERIQNLEAEVKVLQRQIDSQLAFIKEIGKQSENNPLLTHLLNKVRDNLSKRQNK